MHVYLLLYTHFRRFFFKETLVQTNQTANAYSKTRVNIDKAKLSTHVNKT